jgi:hypothetical protein
MLPSILAVPVVLAALLVVEKPTYLVVLDGEPQFASVSGTDFRRIVNTKALVLSDGARLYLDVAGKWMGAPTLDGPWLFATGPLSRLDMARESAAGAGARFEGPPAAVATALERGGTPGVRVVREPTALITVRGAPKLARIRGTRLHWVKNTTAALFLNDAASDWYAMVEGGWYRAKAVVGPWERVEASALPQDFRRIPGDHPRAAALVALP